MSFIKLTFTWQSSVILERRHIDDALNVLITQLPDIDVPKITDMNSKLKR